MKIATILLTFIWAMIYAQQPSAYAAAIANLDDKAQTIELETPSGYTKISIEAGQVYRTIGAIRVRYNNIVSYIEANEEYAIWKNGVFGPQIINHGFAFGGSL